MEVEEEYASTSEEAMEEEELGPPVQTGRSGAGWTVDDTHGGRSRSRSVYSVIFQDSDLDLSHGCVL